MMRYSRTGAIFAALAVCAAGACSKDLDDLNDAELCERLAETMADVLGAGAENEGADDAETDEVAKVQRECEQALASGEDGVRDEIICLARADDEEEMMACGGVGGRKQEAEVEMAKLQVRSFSDDAYVRWRVDHPGEMCPDSLAELGDYLTTGDTTDPWGHELVMRCGADAPAGTPFGVLSKGPDGVEGTGDDITSWE